MKVRRIDEGIAVNDDTLPEGCCIALVENGEGAHHIFVAEEFAAEFPYERMEPMLEAIRQAVTTTAIRMGNTQGRVQ